MEPNLVESSYSFTNEIKVKYNFLRGVSFPSGEITITPDARLADLKRMLQQKYSTKFFVYLKKSFMPAPDSRMGDLVLCYGKTEMDKNDPIKKTYILAVDCSAEPEYG